MTTPRPTPTRSVNFQYRYLAITIVNTTCLQPYLDFLNYVGNLTTVPQTFTTSYGDYEQTVPKDYATSVCNGFATLGARGVSIMFSSGDDGVGDGDCKSNNGTNIVAFQPNFPASCKSLFCTTRLQR